MLPSPVSDHHPPHHVNDGDSDGVSDLDEGGTMQQPPPQPPVISSEHHDNFNDEERGSGSGSHSTLNQPPPPQSVHFFHPQLNKVRMKVFVSWAKMVLILMVFIMAVLSLYWGALFRVEENMSKLVVHVVDMDAKVAPYSSTVDTPLIGPAMVHTVEKIVEAAEPPESPTLGFQVVSAADYDYDPDKVRRAVWEWDIWAAVLINANATALLRDAARIGNASYDPTGAVQYILASARQETNYYNYIIPQLEAVSQAFASSFGPAWVRMLVSSSGNDGEFPSSALARAPAAVNPAVEPLMLDLRPFGPAVATPAVTVGLIYLIIISFFSFGFFMPIHMRFVASPGHPPLHFWQLIAWRWVATVVAYFLISLAYSLVSLAFQINFYNGPLPATQVEPGPGYATAYSGGASFVVYWMINFVGMAALGLACENMAMLMGQPWTAFWLIFWVITNVSTSFYSIELSPNFYKWGYAWPLHSIVEASRMILYDMPVPKRLGKDFGILFAWWAVSTVLFPLCCWFMRWNGIRQKKMEARKQQQQQQQQEMAKGGQGGVDGAEGGLMQNGNGQQEKPATRRRGFFRTN